MKKILVIIPSSNAVGFFRGLSPHQHIIDNYSNDITVEYIYMSELPVGDDIQYEYDLVVFHATCLLSDEFSKQIIKEKHRGVKMCMDIDDYWELPKHNPAYSLFADKLTNLIPKALKWVDAVTTTTKLFSDEIKKYNKNVCVIPNLIFNPRKSTPTNQERLRIGVLCGSSHHEDLKLFGDMVKDLKDYQHKIQFVLCGFDVRGNSHPELSVWNSYEQILTDNYGILDQDYKEMLLNYVEGEYPYTNKPYVRRWSKPMETY